MNCMYKNYVLSLFVVVTLLLVSFRSPNHQGLPTSLRINVLNDAGNLEANAKVTLYKNQQDYDKEQNPVMAAQSTNDKGFVIFRDLEPVMYFVTVVKGDKDNSGGSTQTSVLQKGKLNKVNIIIE